MAGFFELRSSSLKYKRLHKKINLRARKFHFLKYKKYFWGVFFYYFQLGLKSALGSFILYYYSTITKL